MANIGQGIDRVDGRLKVTGQARYAAEFAVPDVVHAVLVNSTIGAGAIAGFDVAAARAMPGVLAIITPDNAPKLQIKWRLPAIGSCAAAAGSGHPLQRTACRRRRGGDPEQADAAASLVRVRYRRDEPVTSMDVVLGQAYTPKSFRNGTRPADSRRGDPDSAFDGGAVEGGCHLHHADGTSQSDGAARDSRALGWQRLTVWTATQAISGAQQTLASLFGIEQANVRVICPYVGGGFGCKGNTWPPATLAAMAAKVVGKPVKLV